LFLFDPLIIFVPYFSKGFYYYYCCYYYYYFQLRVFELKSSVYNLYTKVVTVKFQKV